jgi:hypothetical protein
MSMNNSSNTIGNRNHDFPACTVVPHIIYSEHFSYLRDVVVVVVVVFRQPRVLYLKFQDGI